MNLWPRPMTAAQRRAWLLVSRLYSPIHSLGQAQSSLLAAWRALCGGLGQPLHWLFCACKRPFPVEPRHRDQKALGQPPQVRVCPQASLTERSAELASVKEAAKAEAARAEASLAAVQKRANAAETLAEDLRCATSSYSACCITGSWSSSVIAGAMTCRRRPKQWTLALAGLLP